MFSVWGICQAENLGDGDAPVFQCIYDTLKKVIKQKAVTCLDSKMSLVEVLLEIKKHLNTK